MAVAGRLTRGRRQLVRGVVTASSLDSFKVLLGSGLGNKVLY